MPEMTQEIEKVASMQDGQEYECEYAAAPNKNVDFLVLVEKSTQLFVWNPYLGWVEHGLPEISHDLMPMQLRDDGHFADMRKDPGFSRIVKQA